MSHTNVKLSHNRLGYVGLGIPPYGGWPKVHLLKWSLTKFFSSIGGNLNW